MTRKKGTLDNIYERDTMETETNVNDFVVTEAADLTAAAQESVQRGIGEPRQQSRLLGNFNTTINVQAIGEGGGGGDTNQIRVYLIDRLVGYIEVGNVNDGKDDSIKVYVIHPYGRYGRKYFSELDDAVTFLIYAKLSNLLD